MILIVLPLTLKDERTSKMSETAQFKNFRIWAAVGVALLYIVLAASGNA